jgi:uncharacterized protein (DUF2147 family)
MKKSLTPLSASRLFSNSLCLIAACLFFIGTNLSAQSADAILGKYMVPSKDGAIEVYKTGTKYYGKIVLNKDPEKLDINNPDKTKQSRKVLGTTILNDFLFKGEQLWADGTIYDPKNGKTYSCKITRLENGDLQIRGFIGISLLGRTETFVRLKN